MNISPMNMQVVIPKATEVGKGQQQREQQTVFQQDFGAEKYQQNAHQRLKQVQKAEESESKKINDNQSKEEKRRGQQNFGEKNKKKENDEEVVMAVDTFRGHNIDIKM